MKYQTSTTCFDCEKETNQKVLFVKKVSTKIDDEDDGGLPTLVVQEYMVVQCAGCDTISFLLRESGSALFDENGDEAYSDYNYPSINEDGFFNFLSEQEHFQLPKTIRELYIEIRSAFNSNSSILAGIGLRTLLEGLCLNQKIQGKNLQEKIRNLQSAGLIATVELPIIDKLRLIGNSSAHEMKSLSIHTLGYALDIINHVLKSVYILPKINRKLKL